MYDYSNSSVIYVAPKNGDDNNYNGLTPTDEGAGNGPFKTLERAFESIAQRRTTGFMRPMTIALTEDLYAEKTISLYDNEALKYLSTSVNAVTLESFGERKKIVGGIKIDGWKKDCFNGKECISSTLPKRSDGEMWDLHDLFVNGKRADNTRYPEHGYLKCVDTENNVPTLFASSKWFIANKEDLENIDRIEDATVNFYHFWIDEHSPIESYDRNTGKLTMKYPSRFAITNIYYPEEDTSALNYYLENIPKTFSKPNEWYYDKKSEKVYYIPENFDIDLSTIEAYSPTIKKLFEFKGKADEKISDIKLSNLELMCTRSDYVSKHVRNVETSDYEYNSADEIGYASDIQSACFTNGAVSFEHAERCSVENCLIHQIGTYGVEIKNGCKAVRLENNTLEDIGAGGIKIFGGKAGSDECDLTCGCIIRGNKISDCGKKFAAGCGILVCHACENEISENEICNLDYSGISVGWVWGYADSSSYGNIIRKNHIHHIGTGKLSDMGGIYLLGKQPGTVVSYNRIHDVSSAHYGGWGIYTDEGSSYITVENNVVYNTKCESFHQHYGSCNVVRNNIFAFGSACLRASRTEIHDGIIFENNIFITNGNPVYGELCSLFPITSKKNIIWDVSGKEPVLRKDADGRNIYLKEFCQKYGKEYGTIVADPKIADISKYDFTISENSEAIENGFKPIKGFTASGT